VQLGAVGGGEGRVWASPPGSPPALPGFAPPPAERALRYERFETACDDLDSGLFQLDLDKHCYYRVRDHRAPQRPLQWLPWLHCVRSQNRKPGAQVGAGEGLGLFALPPCRVRACRVGFPTHRQIDTCLEAPVVMGQILAPYLQSQVHHPPAEEAGKGQSI
jgi:hypothetical protein